MNVELQTPLNRIHVGLDAIGKMRTSADSDGPQLVGWDRYLAEQVLRKEEVDGERYERPTLSALCASLTLCKLRQDRDRSAVGDAIYLADQVPADSTDAQAQRIRQEYSLLIDAYELPAATVSAYELIQLRGMADHWQGHYTTLREQAGAALLRVAIHAEAEPARLAERRADYWAYRALANGYSLIISRIDQTHDPRGNYSTVYRDNLGLCADELETLTQQEITL